MKMVFQAETIYRKNFRGEDFPNGWVSDKKKGERKLFKLHLTKVHFCPLLQLCPCLKLFLDVCGKLKPYLVLIGIRFSDRCQMSSENCNPPKKG